VLTAKDENFFSPPHIQDSYLHEVLLAPGAMCLILIEELEGLAIIYGEIQVLPLQD
jgi:hypothetical protein